MVEAVERPFLEASCKPHDSKLGHHVAERFAREHIERQRIYRSGTARSNGPMARLLARVASTRGRIIAPRETRFGAATGGTCGVLPLRLGRQITAIELAKLPCSVKAHARHWVVVPQWRQVIAGALPFFGYERERAVVRGRRVVPNRDQTIRHGAAPTSN